MRSLDRVSTQLTTLHKIVLDDLFKLATTVYTEVDIFLNLKTQTSKDEEQ